jgi:hypothetical protein
MTSMKKHSILDMELMSQNDLNKYLPEILDKDYITWNIVGVITLRRLYSMGRLKPYSELYRAIVNLIKLEKRAAILGTTGV